MRDRRAVRPPSRTVVQASPARRHRAPAGLRSAAIPPNRQCGAGSRRSRRRQAPVLRSERSERSTPLLALILRAMSQTRRHPGRSSGLSVFSLLSVLVLLALASFPVLAQAEDSSSVQYQEAPPEIIVPGNTKKAHKSQPGKSTSEAEGNASNAPGAGGGSGGSNG